jgi:F-type H+-transporting ATPase subunit b
MHIDWWTLALQTVNVLVLIWILARFFFRPVSEIIARRQEDAAKMLADSDTARRAANEERIRAQRARADFEAAKEGLISEARREADVQRREILHQASAEVAKLRADAEAASVRNLATMEGTLIARARGLSIEIARHLVQRLSVHADIDVFLNAMCEQVRKLSPQMRAGFLGEGDGGATEVVTAAELPTEEAAQIRGALERAFGAALRLKFRCDPGVLAGIELHSAHAYLRSSWREDLDRIDKELSRDDKRPD